MRSAHGALLLLALLVATMGCQTRRSAVRQSLEGRPVVIESGVARPEIHPAVLEALMLQRELPWSFGGYASAEERAQTRRDARVMAGPLNEVLRGDGAVEISVSRSVNSSQIIVLRPAPSARLILITFRVYQGNVARFEGFFVYDLAEVEGAFSPNAELTAEAVMARAELRAPQGGTVDAP